MGDERQRLLHGPGVQVRESQSMQAQGGHAQAPRDRQLPRGPRNRDSNSPTYRTYAHVFYIAVITDWPWKIAACKPITGLSEYDASDSQKKCLSRSQWLYVLVRFILVFPIGLVAQAISCFRRDRLDTNSLRIPGENDTRRLMECHEAIEIFRSTFIPGMIFLLLLVLVSWRRLFKCDTTDCKLTELVEAIKLEGPDKCMRIYFPLIPIVYVILSLAVSAMSLFAFHIVDGNVVIHWKEATDISGSLKTTILVLVFVGFFAFDLLYTQLVLRYAFQCRMNMHFLKIIEGRVKSRPYMYQNEDDAIADVEMAHKFLKQLNKSSTVIGLVILITGRQAVNTIINLLNESNDYFQIVALAARFSLWTFLTLFPVFQAARINEASEKLCETGLPMYRKPIIFGNLRASPQDQNDSEIIKMHSSPIVLEAKLFGFSIHPWFPYVIIILILFTLMVGGSNFKWYERLF